MVSTGQKRCETRSWPARCKLPFTLAIHASKQWSGSLYQQCREPLFKAALDATGCRLPIQYGRSIPRPAGMAFGAIVAVCRVVGCVPTSTLGVKGTWSALLTAREEVFGNYQPGRWAWILTEVRRLAEPLPCPGALGLWTVPRNLWPLIAGGRPTEVTLA